MTSRYQKPGKILLSKTRALKILGVVVSNAIPSARNAQTVYQFLAFKKVVTLLIRQAPYEDGKFAKK